MMIICVLHLIRLWEGPPPAPPLCNPLHSNPDSLHLQSGATPLYIAAQNGQLEVVRLLLGQGADKVAAVKVVVMWLPH
jgi:ankyrin repeat protein